MQKHRPVKCPSLPPRLGVRRFAVRCERPAAHHGGVSGVDAPPNAGCVGRGCDAERCGQEGAR